MTTRLLHPTSRTLKGVWLLDHDALRELDVELDAICERLDKIRMESIQKATRQAHYHINQQQVYKDHPDEKKKALASRKKEIESSYKHEKNRCLAILHCKHNRRVELPRLAQGFSSAETRDVRPESLDVRIEIGEIDTSLNLAAERLSIRVHPDKNDESSWVFARLEAWAIKHKADRTVSFWNSASLLLGSVGFSVFITTLLFTVAYVLTPPRFNKTQLRDHARELLADGLADIERTDAIETILSFVAEVPVNQHETVQAWPTVPLGILAICGTAIVVAVFHPTTKIGVGLGAMSLVWHKRWIRFVTYVLPTFLVFGVIASAFGSELHRLFTSAGAP